MNLYRELASNPPRTAAGGTRLGAVIGIVTNNEDPDNQGRVKVKFPWLAENEESAWARTVLPLAGKDRGLFFLPEVGDEVLVVFEHGDLARPYVLGGLWNGVDLPPTDAGDGRDTKVLRSKSGHVIRIDDSQGGEKIEILDKTGKNMVVIDAATSTITVASDKDIELKAPQGKIRLEAQALEMKSAANSKLEAAGTLTIKGSTVSIN